jgi:hypothetical protein
MKFSQVLPGQVFKTERSEEEALLKFVKLPFFVRAIVQRKTIGTGNAAAIGNDVKRLYIFNEREEVEVVPSATERYLNYIEGGY